MSSLFVICCLATMMCLASLLGFWAVLGHRALWVRGVGFLFGNLVLGLATCAGLREFEMEWVLLVTLATSFVAGLAGVLRLFGVRVVPLSDKLDQTTGELQFSLRQMMTVVTVIAGLLAIGRASADLTRDLAFGVSLAIGFALVAVSVLWGTLSNHGIRLRVASVCVMAFATACAAYYVMEVTAVDPGYLWFSIVIAYTTLLSLALISVRVRGYRLAH